jgi:hypothetical protein
MTIEASKLKETIQKASDAFEFFDAVKGIEGFDAILEKVPSNKEAALLCIYLMANHEVKNAWCDHHVADPEWMKVLAIMWKHFPEFSTNLETGERFL